METQEKKLYSTNFTTFYTIYKALSLALFTLFTGAGIWGFPMLFFLALGKKTPVSKSPFKRLKKEQGQWFIPLHASDLMIILNCALLTFPLRALFWGTSLGEQTAVAELSFIYASSTLFPLYILLVLLVMLSLVVECYFLYKPTSQSFSISSKALAGGLCLQAAFIGLLLFNSSLYFGENQLYKNKLRKLAPPAAASAE